MKKANAGYSIKEMCSAFDVPYSSYYYQPVGLSERDEKLVDLIRVISATSGSTYGKRRIRAQLNAQDVTIGLGKTRRLMKVAGIVVIVTRKRHYYPDSGQEHQYAPNLLSRNFTPQNINTHWVGDITYIRNYCGWSYLACVMDLKTKEIVGHAMSTSPDAALTKRALVNAIRRQKPDTAQLMFHSDQGCQYSAQAFRDCLQLHNITQSMSRRGNCWDNAVMERFFRSLKSERLNKLSFTNHGAAVAETEKYIYFYNYQRRHSAIGYITPHQMACELKNVA